VHPHPRLQQLHRHLASPITHSPYTETCISRHKSTLSATRTAGFGVFEVAVSEARYAHHPIPRNLGAIGYLFGAKRDFSASSNH